ncbi:hypothetical protein DL93DRAFT_2166678 [Clavulina sp. PMI_390]|nr:hypothetical protein DL93DRAFT_2166678 [Clavulina sp. PMI_390]
MTSTPIDDTPAAADAPQKKSIWKKAHDKTFKLLDKTGVKVGKASDKIGVENFWPGPMQGEVQKAARIIHKFTVASPENPAKARSKNVKKVKALFKIPAKHIREAEGLAIFTVFRTGLLWSGAGGSGIVIARNQDRSWGLPSGILIHTLGYGFLAGADVYDVVLVLRNRRAVNAFTRPKISLGGELGVTAGKTGAGAAVDVGIEAAPVLSYVKGKGLYGGLQVDGNIIIQRQHENGRFYGRAIQSKEILTSYPTKQAETEHLAAPMGSLDSLYHALHVAEATPDPSDGSQSATISLANPFSNPPTPGASGSARGFMGEPQVGLQRNATTVTTRTQLPGYEEREGTTHSEGDDLYDEPRQMHPQSYLPEKTAPGAQFSAAAADHGSDSSEDEVEQLPAMPVPVPAPALAGQVAENPNVPQMNPFDDADMEALKAVEQEEKSKGQSKA